MNIGSSSTNPKVTSKYFNSPSSSIASGMDESLSEFKEEKKKYKGPKEVKVKKKLTQKPRKPIKGQKDIRTALKPKKNDLLTYANDFDNICKQSGIDIDSEQLQLAIALSKSLETENVDEPNTCSETRDRAGTIRRTLQEYGFKVPENKFIAKRKVKRYRKRYKLLLTSIEEKQQIISDRYSQILFKNIEHVSLEGHKSTKLDLLYIATEISYDLIKDSNFFYIKNLIEQHPNSVGSLLKSWSLIPGRPKSPISEKSEFKLSDLKITQENLDVILSGTLKSAQETIKSLNKNGPEEESRLDICYKSVEKSSNVIDTKMDEEDEIIISLEDDENCEEKCSFIPITEKHESESSFKIYHVNQNQPSIIKNDQRCSSPDLFDDELSVMEKTEEITMEKSSKFLDLTNCILATSSQNDEKSQLMTQKYQSKLKYHDFMEITDCVAENSRWKNSVNVEQSLFSSQKSQGNNFTKRKSDDFMETTDCVAGSTQPLLENIIEVNIDLTQNSDEYSIENKDTQIDSASSKIIHLTQDCNETSSNKNTKNSNKDLECLDLTQSSNSEDDLPVVQISGQQVSQGGRRRDNEYGLQFNRDSQHANEECEQYEEGRKVNKDDDQLPKKDSSLNDTIILNNDEYECLNAAPINIALDSKDKPERSIGIGKSKEKSKCDSLFDEFHYIHSDEDLKRSSDHSKENTYDSSSSKNSNLFEIDCIENLSKEKDLCRDVNIVHDIDLTENCIKISRDKLLNIVNDIDLTQSSNDDEQFSNSHIDTDKSLKDSYDSSQVASKRLQESYQRPEVAYESPQVASGNEVLYENLGKRNDVSIDYEEIFDDDSGQHNINSKQHSFDSKSTIENDNKGNYESKNLERSDSVISSCSQNSEVFVISDNEFNYSVNQSRCEMPEENYEIPEENYYLSQENLEIPEENFDFGGMSIMDNLSNAKSSKSLRKSAEKRDTFQRIKEKISSNQTDSRNDSFLPIIDVGYSKNKIIVPENASSYVNSEILDVPCRKTSKENIIETPSNTKYIIKTDQVTPMLDFGSMTTPERNKELDRYGLKPFKRKRAIQLLTHLYNQTHPIVASCSKEDAPSPSKKQKPNSLETLKSIKTNHHEEPISQHSPKKIFAKQSPRKCLSQNFLQKSPEKSTGISPIKFDSRGESSTNSKDSFSSTENRHKKVFRRSPRECLTQNSLRKSPKKNVGISPIKLATVGELTNSDDHFSSTTKRQNQSKSPRKRSAKSSSEFSPKINDNFEWLECDDLYEVTNEKPVIKAIDCDEDDWVFQKREKAELQSCRVPLHIAFHNYASARPNLREAILRYEPVNIDDIHKGLLLNGFRFDPKDLLKFLDKKCITVKTADNDSNKKTQNDVETCL